MKKIILLLIFVILITGCTKIKESTQEQTQLPNPASVYCEEQSGTLRMEEDEYGAHGICILPGGTECEEWAYFKGECPKVEEETSPLENQEQITTEDTLKETQTDWPTFHGDSARTGFSTSSAPSKPNVLWKWTLNNFMEIDYDENFEGNWLIIDNNKLFYAPEYIFAFDLKTGKKIWAYSEDDNFYPRGLAAGDGKIFISVNRGDNLKSLPPGVIYALDESTGRFLWKYQTKKGVSHSLPLFVDGKVFVGDDSGTMYALDAKTGNLVWESSLNAEVIHSSPAFENGIIFVGTEGTARSNDLPSYLYALKASDGSELWKFQIDYIPQKLNLIHSTPAVSKGVVYIGSENGYFYALSSSDGKLIWKNKIASGNDQLIGTSAAAALGYGKVFIGTYEGKFLALNQKDGKIVWEYNFGKANADSSPVLADEKVYFGVGEGGNGYFYSFNANNGEIIWKEKIGGSSATLANGILIVQNDLAEDNLQPSTPIIIAFSDEGKLPLW